MRIQAGIVSCLASSALAARPFLNEPDTGIEDVLKFSSNGTLPNITSIVGLPDFEYVARKYLPTRNFTYYRNGAAGEYSYRNNLEVFRRYRLRPRVLVDISNIESTLSTTILGHNFSAPFFISPCARADYAHANAEINFVKGAAAGNILYMLYLDSNETFNKDLFRRTEAAGAKAIVFTVDSAADGNRHRAARFGVGSADSSYSAFSWTFYEQIRNQTKLPIILKGIMTVEDAQEAVKRKVPAIILSNHGGRQLDGSPSSLEVALEIYRKDPDLFKKIEVLADGGIRYGVDAIMLLSLGVKAVGLGRPFMYSNIYGQEGVEKVIQIMKHEMAIDAGNLGIPDLKKVSPNFVDWTPSGWSM
ncbi:(S)-2-hydroxy-acid oxidase, putative [Metarhizium acridum CQMa 102]|uniref:(S)-2-hydroxy-acid oxidase, putative n=1 Tax=Metarhizium acridum (strain CQMa 102) TaxID=655827 RepID=E9E9U6_METAQ|nr:(S)-2-hydroxy-acid oxidase, putative [Metarhizium acridum CQMa 102]EFY87297.1 (S)-2-hydroxy-acid oxidase, putative [Metarhizium acridum CQMa 102]